MNLKLSSAKMATILFRGGGMSYIGVNGKKKRMKETSTLVMTRSGIRHIALNYTQFVCLMYWPKLAICLFEIRLDRLDIPLSIKYAR